ncbi:pRiA4b ORF-3-like protein [Gillisia sp. Hel_I_86]|uniref:IS1096 element passenger TnpR family protein n=1 Tax=Gillisia sp. Hel_I_86 TaxID=1249981 RepID=UPI00119AC04A|nr:plasmid pRiA4b ORF-3 family protein [Gillisia sp. Hel_I_86]TVZ25195.1 pRiA4b ORF-3-like protein [Gillisia sp. Hel_I_86]
MVYRFRVILDTQDDVFRDIEILEESTLEDFHNAIVNAFGFDGNEMAAFYISDEEWNQGEEISQFDLGEDLGSVRLMNETTLDSVVSKKQRKLIYVYDFLSMWTFLIELADIAEIEDGRDYPNLMYVHGQIPADAPDKEFIADKNEYDDDDDSGLDLDNFDDLSYDDIWN